MKTNLNKFEKARLLSARGQELASGAKPMIDISKMDTSKILDYTKIAEMEFEAGVLELEIVKK